MVVRRREPELAIRALTFYRPFAHTGAHPGDGSDSLWLRLGRWWRRFVTESIGAERVCSCRARAMATLLLPLSVYLSVHVLQRELEYMYPAGHCFLKLPKISAQRS